MEKRKHYLLVNYYNKHGINDGVAYIIVNDRLQTVSNHRVRERAEEKLRKLNR